MSRTLSRRELLAWLGAGAGAASTGALLLDRSTNSGSSSAGARGSTPSTSSGPAESNAVSTSGLSPAAAATANGLAAVDDRVLVVVELPGGNDGLSTVVPYGDPAYSAVRDVTAIAADDVLRIDDEVGLHPNLSGLHGRGVAVVEGVGSTTPNGSHFEMMNRWWAGEPDVSNLRTGWIGRLGDVLDDGSVPVNALSIGRSGHPIVRSEKGTTITLPGADALWAVTGAHPDDLMMSSYQSALRRMTEMTDGRPASEQMVRIAQLEAYRFADQLSSVEDEDAEADDSANEGDQRELRGYTWSTLGNGLFFAANAIQRDLGVRVVHVSADGDYDTHEGHAYRHPELMADLDANLAAFHADLDARGLGGRAMVMTVSEFGRTVRENGSGGLDHGTASAMLISGGGVTGRFGERSSLTRLDENDDLIAHVPFDDYLGGVLEHWLEVPASEIFGDVDPLAFA